MKRKSNILKSFLATASLCGSLLSNFNANATGTIVSTTGLVDVNLSTGAGLVGKLFNDGNIIQVVASVPGVKILANKANAQIGGITTAVALGSYGGVEVSANTSIGPLDIVVLGIEPKYGPLKFTADNVTAIITGVGSQTFTTMDSNGKNSTFQINDNLTIKTTIDNTNATVNGTLNLGNGVSITKGIGGSNALSAVNINGSGTINFGGIVKATTIKVANTTANVTATGLVTGALKYAAAGSFTANAGLAGNLNFQNNAGIFTLADNATINGNINSTVNGVGAVNGTLNATSGAITGTINNLNILRCSAGNGQTLILDGAANISSIFLWIVRQHRELLMLMQD